MIIELCVKMALFCWMEVQLECFLNAISGARCHQCTQRLPFGVQHACYRIRRCIVPFESSDLLLHFMEARAQLLNMIHSGPCMMADVQSLLKVELLQHEHDPTDIYFVNQSANIIIWAESWEAAYFIFDNMWMRHLEATTPRAARMVDGLDITDESSTVWHDDDSSRCGSPDSHSSTPDISQRE